MQTIRKKSEMAAMADAWHGAAKTICLVPTMGFLHEGHVSLIRQAKLGADIVVVSIFVNPTQFGPNEDFAAYPRDEARDLALCEQEGVDAVFAPTPEEMYPEDATTRVAESALSAPLCGISRPTHFSGVLTVVAKLFHITRADSAVFGAKDAQQLACIRRMVRDLDFPVSIIPAPIVREPDGLAMSSRNAYLTPEQRQTALCLRRALDLAEAAYADGETDAAEVMQKMCAVLGGPDVQIDYVDTVDADTLAPVTVLRPNTLIALAVKVGATRLIDNTTLR